jgi:hypothetical protein
VVVVAAAVVATVAVGISLSKESLPIYKRHRAAESVLNIMFRDAQ